MADPLTLSFYGGAGTVTGSKFLVTAGTRRVLLDCGLFQGLKELRRRNWDPPPFDPKSLDAIIISHAHIDHCGYLPVLVQQGFRGQILCTGATVDLLRLVLMDSAHLQEEEAQAANRGGYTRHHPALPLYTTRDVYATLSRVIARPYGQLLPVADGVRVHFRRAGHILGAATVELLLGDPGDSPVRLLFSGDLGRPNQPILRDPEDVAEADVLLLESTYGDHVHAADPGAELARVITEAVQRGGALIVPSLLWRTAARSN
jgi:metallo-beta-lactamase family protein